LHAEALAILITVLATKVPEKKRHKVVKVVLLCCFSSFFGHNNLCQVLKAYNKKSTSLYAIYNSLSFGDFSTMTAMLFEHYISERLVDLGGESNSTWSRLSPTYIIDASIFRTWLKKPENEFFDKFFSGQTGKPEYGYKITLGGMAIGDTFYPLSFYVSSKKHTDSEIAQILLYDMHRVIKQIEMDNNLKFGQLYLSVDCGYSHPDLFEYAEKLKIIPISVPKKNHLFEIDGKNTNLTDFIDNVFIPKEEKYYSENGKETQPFTLRIRAIYKCRKTEVVLLFFRLAKSDNVSVVYSTDLDIKAKTLRHHWFQRTHIEQFFRFCKHTLELATSTYSSVDDFLKKICLFFLKALFCTIIRNAVRRKKGMKKITFGTIRSLVTTRRIGEQWLIDLMNLDTSFE